MRSRSIYVLVDPRDRAIRYVGATVAPKRRLKSHRLNRTHGKRLVAWIVELSAVGLSPIMEIIEIVPPDGDWEERERHWIAYYRESANLLNEARGGRTCAGVERSAETRAAIAAAQRGVPRGWGAAGAARVARTQLKPGHRLWDSLSDETRERMREDARRRWDAVPPETRSAKARQRNLSAWAAMTPEQRAERGRRIREGQFRAMSPEERSRRASLAAQAGVRARERE